MPKIRLLSRSRAGFTIIEVMIVLIIAAAILLIVFLAVPAFQRNARNTRYRNEAQRVLALAGEYASNNGNLYPCHDAGNSRCNPSGSNAASWSDFITNYLDSNLTTQPHFAYRTAYNGETSNYWLTGGSSSSPPGMILYWMGASCTSSGILDPTLSDNPRQIAVWIKLSTTEGYCVTNAPR